ncbi:Cuticle protein 16.8 [Nymphon striatum]|nr:Cuticle protein 16.8 [Nymphon striatum]
MELSDLYIVFLDVLRPPPGVDIRIWSNTIDWFIPYAEPYVTVIGPRQEAERGQKIAGLTTYLFAWTTYTMDAFTQQLDGTQYLEPEAGHFFVLLRRQKLDNLSRVSSRDMTDTGAECLNHQKSEQEPTNMLKVETYEKPQPFEFAYEIVDDYYNTQARQESGDEYGNVKGSYSQKNAEGLERVVEYVADEGGFRAIVKTNEPGTDNQNSADVEITADPVVVKVAPKKGYAAPAYGHRAYAAPSYGYSAYAAPAYGHRAHGYGAPAYGHRAHGYGTPAYGQTHGYGNYERNYGRTHSYQAQKPHGIKATGHASTTYSAGYGKDGYSHSVAKVHSKRYEAPKHY